MFFSCETLKFICVENHKPFQTHAFFLSNRFTDLVSNTSMTKIKVACHDRLIVKHVFICGLNEPKQNCKRFCKYSQNMVRNAKFVPYRVQGTCYGTNLAFPNIL